ncbi:MAG: GNAT family N-acetyltransferase [Rhizobiaceae bacterium]
MSEAALRPIQVTVTFLEMAAPPRTYPHAPSNRQIALLRAKDMPLHFYRYLMDRVGRKWHWVNALRLSDDALAAMIDRSDIGVLYLDGAPAGFFEIRMHAPDTAELAFFGLMEHATGQGLGRWFLGAAIEAAWSHHPRRVSVQTCTLDHPAALPLYQKLGFSPIGQQTETVRPLSPEERAGLVTR